MKLSNVVWAVLMALPCQSLEAAYQTFTVKTHPILFENGIRRRQSVRESYGFRVEVISDDEGLKPENVKNGRPFVAARTDERYAVRLYNPLPVRVAVNLTVDGLNSITGKPSGISDGDKWIISPYESITIRGWQVNGAEARRFFFTPKPKSYAKWQGDRLDKDLSANCGVIGAAYFWSQKELDAYYEAHPQYQYPSSNLAAPEMPRLATSAASAAQEGSRRGMRQEDVTEAKSLSEKKAGTGMGERESNPTETVDFQFDRGMYRVSQAIVIYYAFAEASVPNPFPAISFAPEMP